MLEEELIMSFDQLTGEAVVSRKCLKCCFHSFCRNAMVRFQSRRVMLPFFFEAIPIESCKPLLQLSLIMMKITTELSIVQAECFSIRVLPTLEDFRLQTGKNQTLNFGGNVHKKSITSNFADADHRINIEHRIFTVSGFLALRETDNLEAMSESEEFRNL